MLGFARSGNEAAVQLFAIRDGKTVSRDVFLLENLGDGAGRGGAVGLREAVLRHGRLGAAAGPGAVGACRTRRSWRRSCARAAAAA